MYLTESVADPPLKGIRFIKYDIQSSAIIGDITFSDDEWPSLEAILMPKKGNNIEDDVYIATYIYNEKDTSMVFKIWDAKTMNSNPLTIIDVPVRVPIGFHGIFVQKENS
mmetsp:Transcript_104151/g.127241  ORF Transcript_104151/g.127241 Transcript_104151/m.127241 type:complete len:110 (-) Transcript_104151:53-382(-)